MDGDVTAEPVWPNHSVRIPVMLSHIVRGFHFGIVLSLSLLAAGWTVPVQAQVKLEHKIVEGRKTVTHTTMKSKQSLTLAGIQFNTDSDRFIISTAQTGKRDAQGKIRIEITCDKLTATDKSHGLTGFTVSFDSDDPNKKADNDAAAILELHLQLLRAVANSRPVWVCDQSCKVIAVEGLDKPAEEVWEEFRGDFDPDQAKKCANQKLEILPTKPIKVGDIWTKTVDSPLGSGQILSITSRYKYLGEVKVGDKKYDKIIAKVTAVALSTADVSKATLRVANSNLNPVESAGEILFDRVAGEFHSTKGKIRVQGNVNFTTKGLPVSGAMDLTIENETVRQL